MIIGTASFLDDVVRAVGAFVAALKGNADLLARVAARLPKVVQTFPVSQQAEGEAQGQALRRGANLWRARRRNLECDPGGSSVRRLETQKIAYSRSFPSLSLRKNLFPASASSITAS